MTTTKKTLIIIGVVVLVIIIWVFGSYNSLVTQKENATAQWQQVETVYQRRFDLIPNLVESVKGLMKQEQAVFLGIADARAHYSGAQTVNDKARAAGEVESALSRLLVVMENYPAINSSETVKNLMIQLEGTENRISVERQRYNDEVKAYEVSIKRFPRSIIAGMFGFGDLEYFQAQAGAESAPKVGF